MFHASKLKIICIDIDIETISLSCQFSIATKHLDKLFGEWDQFWI